MSSLFQRGNRWVIQYRQGGRTVQRSTGITVEVDPRGQLARQVQRDIDTQAARQIAQVEDERLTIRVAIERFLETKRQVHPRYQVLMRTRAERMADFFEARGARLLEQVTPAMLDAWIHQRMTAGSAPKTIRMEIDSFRAMARLANRTRTVRPIPVDTWPTVQRVTTLRPDRIGAYTQAEVEAILDDLDRWDRRRQWVLPVLCLAYLGCRWGELAAMRVGDVDLAASPPVARIESHKTARTVAGQHRYVEIHPRLAEALAPQVRGRRKSEILLDLPDQHNVTNVLGRCCKRLGIQYKRLHGLRHFWITSMLAAGAPLAVVMQQCGHRHLSTTQGYLHLPDRHVGWVGKALGGVSVKVSVERGGK